MTGHCFLGQPLGSGILDCPGISNECHLDTVFVQNKLYRDRQNTGAFSVEVALPV